MKFPKLRFPEVPNWAFGLILLASWAVTVYRNLQPPNYFALGHLVYSYEGGLMRRGLLGSLAALMGGPHWYANGGVETLAYLLTAGSVLTLIGATFLVARSGTPGKCVALAIACSGWSVEAVWWSGYIDCALTMLAAAGLILLLTKRPALACIPALLAIFFHENSLFTVTLPLVVASLLLQKPKVAGAIACSAALALGTLMFNPPERVQIENQLREVQVINQEQKRMLMGWQITTWDTYFKGQYHTLKERMRETALRANILPCLLLLLAFAQNTFAWEWRDRKTLLFCLVGLAPLALLLIAWDISRLAGFGVQNMLLIAAWLSWQRKAQPETDCQPVLVMTCLWVLLTGALPTVLNSREFSILWYVFLAAVILLLASKKNPKTPQLC
jgi:hypothetical protein